MKKAAISPERLAELRAMTYSEYLRTPEWANKRTAALLHAERRCQVCNAAQELQVHHRTYERFGNERFIDLIVLCKECHVLFHSNRRLVRVNDDRMPAHRVY